MIDDEAIKNIPTDELLEKLQKETFLKLDGSDCSTYSNAEPLEPLTFDKLKAAIDSIPKSIEFEFCGEKIILYGYRETRLAPKGWRVFIKEPMQGEAVIIACDYNKQQILILDEPQIPDYFFSEEYMMRKSRQRDF